MTRRHRAATIVAALLTATLAFSPAAVAEGPTEPSAVRVPATPAGPATGPGTTVTLITGDRVTVGAGPGGRNAVKVEPAQRPDGSKPAITVSTRGGDDLYAIPDDVLPLLAAKRLDVELFNVSYLAENGYADSASGSLPVIVQLSPRLAAADRHRSARALAHAAVTRTLESIDGAALSVDKRGASGFWRSLRADAERTGRLRDASAFGHSVTRVSLDRRIRADLTESVAMIGAPRAWQGGYDGSGVKVAVLDTGVDPAHPDLAGQVDASQSFVPRVPVTDRNGHGTHVAATIAGTGRAGDSGRIGVAPKAGLVVGKVLDNDGVGLTSWIIEGMEWAAVTQGADVINMSLGGRPDPFFDELSFALDALTEQTGALFVVSGGNSGPGAGTIGTPGIAASALTVAAVDKSGKLAGFSSRGPGFGGVMKPDVSAPGVGIVAARAAGTSIGTPVDAYYSKLSGTSMAAPHVAGAAALLAQRRPDWTAAELKAALTSTSVDGGYTAYEQGAGRVDAAAAVLGDVVAATANVDLATIEYAERTPRTRPVAFRNDSAAAVTLTLATTLTSPDGTPAPSGSLTVDGELTVPAGGTATATLTLDPADLGSGRYHGAVTATTSDGRPLRVPVGFEVGKRKHAVDLVISRRSKDADPVRGGFSCASVALFGIGGEADGEFEGSPVCWEEPAPRQIRVSYQLPAGTYFANAMTDWTAASRGQVALLMEPEAEVDGAGEIVLDADEAQPITLDTPRPAEAEHQWVYLNGRSESGTTYQVWRQSWVYGSVLGWVTPTAPTSTGTFTFSHQWLLAEPRLTMSTTGADPVRLSPFAGYPGTATPFAGSRRLPLVFAGTGTADDFARVDAAGKLVLLRLTDPSSPVPVLSNGQLERARAQGAAGVLFHSEGVAVQLLIPDDPFAIPAIPFAVLPATEADGLIDRLGRGPVEIDMRATPPGESPYLYSIKPYETDRIPDRPHYRFAAPDLAELDISMPADQSGATPVAWVTVRPTDLLFAGVYSPRMTTPRKVRLSVGPLYADAFHVLQANGDDGYYAFDEATRIEVTAGERPVAPGVAAAPVGADVPAAARRWLECSGCRQENVFFPAVGVVTPQRHMVGGLGRLENEAETHLYRDGTEVAPAPPVFGTRLNYELPPDTGRYRLTMDTDWMSTAWDFRSGPVTQDATPDGYACLKTLAGMRKPCRAEPLIFLRYDAGVDLRNTVRTPGVHPLRITAHRQAPTGPDVLGMKVSVSYDRGAHWRAVTVVPESAAGSDRDFVALIPPASGSVTVKAEAWDADGNRVHQVLYDAYRQAR